MESNTTELTAECGCNYTATKRISKTASITSISKTQRATRFNVWSGRRFIAVVFLMTLTLAISQVDAMAMGARLKKRHSNTPLDWENPCHGVFEGTYAIQRSPKMTSLNLLRNATRGEYNTLKASSGQYIDISDIQVWDNYNRTYKFLPKLNRNSSIALRRWYRNMQRYVASFSYLRSKQREFDEIKLNRKESNFSKELKALLDSAQRILCEIESTINHTTPFSGEKKLNSITLEEMNKSLKFRTKKNLNPKLYEVDQLDLKFVKFYFMNFLQKMSQILHKNKKISTSSASSSHSSSETSNVSSNSKAVSSNEINASVRRSNRRKHQAKKQQNNQKRRRLLIAASPN